MPEEVSPESLQAEIETAGQEARISPIDPDFILIFIAALFFDAFDVGMEILGKFTFEIPKVVTIPIDIITFVLFTGWFMWRMGKIQESKKQKVEALKKRAIAMAEKAPEMAQSLKRAAARIGARVVGRVALRAFVRGVLVLIAETIPLLGMIPFWTITVIWSLREK